MSRIGIFHILYYYLIFSGVRRSVNAGSHSFNVKQRARQVHVLVRTEYRKEHVVTQLANKNLKVL